MKIKSVVNVQTLSEEFVTCIAVKGDRHQNIMSSGALKKRVEEPWTIEKVAKIIDFHGYCERRRTSEIVLLKCAKQNQVITWDAMKGDKESNGFIENAVMLIRGIIRTIKCHIESSTQEPRSDESPVLPWLVEHAGCILSRCQQGRDGKTPCICHVIENPEAFPALPLLPFPLSVLPPRRPSPPLHHHPTPHHTTPTQPTPLHATPHLTPTPRHPSPSLPPSLLPPPPSLRQPSSQSSSLTLHVHVAIFYISVCVSPSLSSLSVNLHVHFTLHCTCHSTNSCHRYTNAFALAQAAPQKQSCICHGSGVSLSDVTGGNAQKSSKDRGSSSFSSSRFANKHGHHIRSSCIPAAVETGNDRCDTTQHSRKCQQHHSEKLGRQQ